MFIGGDRGKYYSLSMDLTLLPGTYYIYVEVDWKHAELQIDCFTLVTHSAVEIQPREIPLFKNFLEDTLKSCAV